MTRWCYGLAFVLCVCLLAAGCTTGSNEPKTSQVSGKVELDGKPLDDGDITFEGDPETIPDVLPIKDGAFSGKVKVGKKKVKIQAFKTEPAPPNATANVTEVKTNYLPARFNKETTLTAEVTDSGVNPSEFKVQSK